jgi:hypothetical protein
MRIGADKAALGAIMHFTTEHCHAEPQRSISPLNAVNGETPKENTHSRHCSGIAQLGFTNGHIISLLRLNFDTNPYDAEQGWAVLVTKKTKANEL